LCARVARPALLRGRSTSPLGATLKWRLLALLLLALLVSAWFYDRLVGVRAFGVTEITVGVYWLKVGRIPYGWRGQAPAGYSSGWVGVALGSVLVVVGVLCLV